MYKLLNDCLTNLYVLTNLIWTVQDDAWYPGDGYVGTIGEDIFPGEKVYASQAGRFLKVLSYTDAHKIITLSENSYIPDPDQCIRDGIIRSWW